MKKYLEKTAEHFTKLKKIELYLNCWQFLKTPWPKDRAKWLCSWSVRTMGSENSEGNNWSFEWNGWKQTKNVSI